MKFYYIVVSLTELTGEEIPEANVAGKYDTLEEAQADWKRAIETWIEKSNAPKPEPGKYKPIHVYICEATA